MEFKREKEEMGNGGNITDSASVREEETCVIQSLLVKERDIEYQVIFDFSGKYLFEIYFCSGNHFRSIRFCFNYLILYFPKNISNSKKLFFTLIYFSLVLVPKNAFIPPFAYCLA